MSALGFFRKNQKLVFWVMVALMIVFAAGDAINRLGNWGAGSSDDEKIGTVSGKPIKSSELRGAEQDLQILGSYLRLGGPVGVLRTLATPPGLLGEKGYMLLNLNEEPRLCWALLLREADAMGIDVGKQQIEDFLGHEPLNLDKAAQDQLVAALRKEKITKDDLHRAIGNYLRIALAFETAAGQTVRSEPQLRDIYNNSQQTLELAMVRLAAEDLVEKVAEPTAEQIDALYAQARQYVAGAQDNAHPLKFGYRMQDAIQLEYALLDEQALLEGFEPGEEQILAYWNEHAGEFTKQVPVATQPATATSPATEPTTQYERVPITRLGEARQQIVERLRTEALPDRVERVFRELRRLYEERARDAATADAAFSAACDELSRKGVKGIDGIVLSCKRYGQPLDGKAFAAEPVLASAQYGGGMATQTLVDMVFSVKEFHTDKPDYASPTKIGQLSERPIPATAGGRRGQMLWRIIRAVPSQVPTAEVLSKGLAEAAGNVEKLTGQLNELKTLGGEGPQAAKRLADAERELAAARDQLGLLTRVRDQVRQDAKTQAAYEQTQAEAQELLDKAQAVGLHEAAKAIDKQVEESGPLPREGIYPNPDRTYQWAQQSAGQFYQFLSDPASQQNPMLGQLLQRYQPALLTMPSYYMAPPMVMGVEPGLWNDFAREAYALAPADPTTQPEAQTQPTTNPTSAPAPADSLKIIRLPAQQTVFVVQRVKYTPAYEDRYQQQRASLLAVLAEMRLHEMHLRWYSQKDIVQRTDFEARTK